ncbi:Fibroblast growth factor receptor 1 [Folsomia candida]|uniref:Fibroblast growth factor receptor 1 n=1 Tax=Folsomia candida TaxID=158441 RepID=A0A226DHS0_FOLCA|nr:Fibroblast growth factor receptor 1 [Folsomia candida]
MQLKHRAYILQPCWGFYLQGSVKVLALVEIGIQFATFFIFGYHDVIQEDIFERKCESKQDWVLLTLWIYTHLHKIISIIVAIILFNAATKRAKTTLKCCLFAEIFFYLGLLASIVTLNVVLRGNWILPIDIVFLVYKIYSFWERFEIYKAKLSTINGTTGLCEVKTVAVKSAHTENFMPLMRELMILNCIGKHENLVNLIGACTMDVKQRNLSLVMEYCSFGDLLSYLIANKNWFMTDMGDWSNSHSDYAAWQSTLILSDLLRWAADTARGMEFIASERDNLPLKWMSPEAITDLRFSTYSDVYSYGITLWEYFSAGQTPYAENRYYDTNFIEQLKSGELRPGRPEFASEEIMHLHVGVLLPLPPHRDIYCMFFMQKCKQSRCNRIEELFAGFNSNLFGPICCPHYIELTRIGAHDPTHRTGLATPYQKAFEIPISNLVINYITPLGKGNFGVVYKANFLAEEDLPGHMNERIVAVKTVPRFATSQHFMQLLRELQILNYIGNHDNIVNLIGACTTDVKQKKIFIVLEYCGLGSMLEYLRSNRAELTSECDTESLSRNSDNNAPLTGLCFRDLVIHGDLAARNILLTFDRRVKIGDFGMSNQVFHCKHRWTKANVMIPWRWMAIEGILDKNFSLSCDIWSYGITVWEFFSGGEVPYVGMEYQELCKCWKLDPTERPGFAELKLFFKKIYSNLGQDRRHVSIRMYDSDIEEVDC